MLPAPFLEEEWKRAITKLSYMIKTDDGIICIECKAKQRYPALEIHDEFCEKAPWHNVEVIK